MEYEVASARTALTVEEEQPERPGKRSLAKENVSGGMLDFVRGLPTNVEVTVASATAGEEGRRNASMFLA